MERAAAAARTQANDSYKPTRLVSVSICNGTQLEYSMPPIHNSQIKYPIVLLKIGSIHFIVTIENSSMVGTGQTNQTPVRRRIRRMPKVYTIPFQEIYEDIYHLRWRGPD